MVVAQDTSWCLGRGVIFYGGGLLRGRAQDSEGDLMVERSELLVSRSPCKCHALAQ